VVIYPRTTWLVAHPHGRGGLYLYVSNLLPPEFGISCSDANCAVIALVEYLTSDEAGKPLGDRFAWPIGWVVNYFAGDLKRNVTVIENERNSAVANGKKVV
jgi:hypothetical protein